MPDRGCKLHEAAPTNEAASWNNGTYEAAVRMCGGSIRRAALGPFRGCGGTTPPGTAGIGSGVACAPADEPSLVLRLVLKFQIAPQAPNRAAAAAPHNAKQPAIA